MTLRYFVCLLFSLMTGCVGYIKGDLREDALVHKPLFKTKQIAYVTNPREAQFILSCNQQKYQLEFQYEIQDSSWSTAIMSNLSVFTLGLIPLYSTNNVDLIIRIREGNKILTEEKIDSRAHFYYGIIPLWFSSSENNMNCNEGEGLSGCLYRIAQERAPRRLERILQESGRLQNLCNT